MHTCPDCGKTMATIGGLEIHLEMEHAAPPPEPEPRLVAEAEPEAKAPPVRGAVRATSPMLRGYDPTVPLTALLALAMLIASIGVAVHRSTNPSHPIVASLAAGAANSSDGASTDTTIASVPGQVPAHPAPSPGDSPAAIPPAGSQSPVTAQNSTAGACKRPVDSLSNRNSKRTVDIAQLIRTNTFPPLPLPGFDHPAVAGVGHWGTAKEYLDAGIGPSDATAAQWQQLLIDNGFVGADNIEFANNDSSYGVGVLQFTTAAGARAFNRATLLAACTAGILENAQAMPALTGGMNYLIVNGGPPFRASFVAGDTVVRVHICHCVQAPDDQALAGQWAQAVAARVGAA